MATSQEVLACPMGENDAGAATVGDYPLKLLAGVWANGEGFSGKRPFGNSGWESDVYTALAKAGIGPGKLDSEGWLDYDPAAETVTHQIVADAIPFFLTVLGA